MSKYTFEYYTRVDWVPTITTIAAPTVAQLNAGTALATLLTKDGLQTPNNQNMVDNTSLAERFDAQLVGSFGGPITLKLKRDNDGTDAAWNLFEWGENGFVVIRRGLAYDAAWAAAQKAEVYPAQAHEPVMDNTAANAQQTFTVMLAVTAQPNLRATVAA